MRSNRIEPIGFSGLSERSQQVCARRKELTGKRSCFIVKNNRHIVTFIYYYLYSICEVYLLESCCQDRHGDGKAKRKR